jgi:hypothetical protein
MPRSRVRRCAISIRKSRFGVSMWTRKINDIDLGADSLFQDFSFLTHLTRDDQVCYVKMFSSRIHSKNHL